MLHAQNSCIYVPEVAWRKARNARSRTEECILSLLITTREMLLWIDEFEGKDGVVFIVLKRRESGLNCGDCSLNWKQ